jgi:hypothetical protein
MTGYGDGGGVGLSIGAALDTIVGVTIDGADTVLGMGEPSIGAHPQALMN